MNATKLLAVDRSLDSDKEMIGRFQSAAPGALPVFGSVAGGASELPVEVTVQQPATKEKSGRSMWRTFFGWVGTVEKKNSDAVVEGAGAQPELSEFRPVESKTETLSGQPEAKAESKSRFNVLSGRNPFRRSAKEPVQSEFRFENVRVVCNELHDTDFIIKS